MANRDDINSPLTCGTTQVKVRSTLTPEPPGAQEREVRRSKESMGQNNWQQQVLTSLNDSWMLEAKCRKEKKSTPFFFEDFERSTPAMKNKMVYFCSSCPVMEDCYQHAVNVGETGLWGGTYFLAGKPKNPLKARYLEVQRDRASAKKVS